MKKQTAFDKFCEKEASSRSRNWTNVLMGQNPISVDFSEYGVKKETFAKQARAEGFRTSTWSSEEILIYRGDCLN